MGTDEWAAKRATEATRETSRASWTAQAPPCATLGSAALRELKRSAQSCGGQMAPAEASSAIKKSASVRSSPQYSTTRPPLSTDSAATS